MLDATVAKAVWTKHLTDLNKVKKTLARHDLVNKVVVRLVADGRYVVLIYLTQIPVTDILIDCYYHRLVCP